MATREGTNLNEKFDEQFTKIPNNLFNDLTSNKFDLSYKELRVFLAILKITNYSDTKIIKSRDIISVTGMHSVDISKTIKALHLKKLIFKRVRSHDLEISVKNTNYILHGLGETPKPPLGETPKPCLAESPKPPLGESPNPHSQQSKQLRDVNDPFRIFLEYYKFILERSRLPYPIASFIAKECVKHGCSKQYLKDFIAKFKYNLKCAKIIQRDLFCACYDLSGTDFLDKVEKLKDLELKIIETIRDNRKKYSTSDKENFYYILGSMGFMINQFEERRSSLLRENEKIVIFPRTKVFLERIFKNEVFPQRSNRPVEQFFFSYYLKQESSSIEKSFLETLSNMASNKPKNIEPMQRAGVLS